MSKYGVWNDLINRYCGAKMMNAEQKDEVEECQLKK